MERKVEFYSEGTPCAGLLGVPDDYKPGEKRGAVIFPLPFDKLRVNGRG